MKALAAVVILLGAAAALRAADPPKTPPKSGEGPSPAPTQTRASNSSADLTAAEFALRFEDGDRYADYQKLKPQNRVAVNQAWNQIPAGTKVKSAPLVENLQQMERQANTTNDLNGARKTVNGVTSDLDGSCDGKIVREGCKDTTAIVPTNPTGKSDTAKVESARQKLANEPQGAVTVKAPPPPDAPPEEPKAPPPDPKFQSLLRNATLGALAGALVGIGLLPLLGPIGILVGAALGASMMIVVKKLGG